MNPHAADRHRLASELDAGLASLQLALASAARAALLGYLRLLAKWNRVYNLTSVREPMQMLRLHLLDSLAAVPPLQRRLQAGSVLDVGSGGGLPGVVWAIACPSLDVTCVDSVQKKTAFVQQAAGALGLPNLRAAHARVERLTGSYDVVASRAFASLGDFVSCTRHLLAPGGVWLAMKGREPAREIAALPDDVLVFHVEQLQVPGLSAERCIVWMRPRAAP